MTSAPANLLAVRRLVIDGMGVDPAAVGIVGNVLHRGGYHCGSDRVVTNDYSVVESPRDKAGLSDYASGLDVGLFTREAHNLRTFSAWLVAQCVANTLDTQDFREIIYSPDGRTVKRWDRLRKRSTGDDSHLWHTHISFFRDAIKAGRDQTPVFRRYLATIGTMGDDIVLDADVDRIAAKVVELLPNAIMKADSTPWAADGSATLGGSVKMILDRTGAITAQLAAGDAADLQRDTDLRADVAALQRGDMDADTFVDALQRRLARPVTPEL